MLIFLIKNMYAQPFQSEYIFQFENYNTKLNKTWHTFLKKYSLGLHHESLETRIKKEDETRMNANYLIIKKSSNLEFNRFWSSKSNKKQISICSFIPSFLYSIPKAIKIACVRGGSSSRWLDGRQSRSRWLSARGGVARPRQRTTAVGRRWGRNVAGGRQRRLAHGDAQRNCGQLRSARQARRRGCGRQRGDKEIGCAWEGGEGRWRKSKYMLLIACTRSRLKVKMN